MEPSTINHGLDIAQQWGFVGTGFIGLIIYIIIRDININKNAVLPTKDQELRIQQLERELHESRDRRHKFVEDFVVYKAKQSDINEEIKIDLEKRITRIWLEEKLLPKVEDIASRVIKIEQRLINYKVKSEV